MKKVNSKTDCQRNRIDFRF